VHCSGAPQLQKGLREKDRPVTSFRHQGDEEFSERGAIFLNFVQHIFPGEQKIF